MPQKTSSVLHQVNAVEAANNMPTVFFLLCAAFCEDDDFVMRLKLLQPPGVIKTLKNVFVLHGAPSSAKYIRCAVTHSHSMTAGAAGSCQADQQLLQDVVCHASGKHWGYTSLAVFARARGPSKL